METNTDKPISKSVTFSSVDELEEKAQSFGWNIEYRQLRKGNFSAKFVSLDNCDLSLVSERFNNHLHIHAEPPSGSLGLFLPRFGAGRAHANGTALSERDLIVLPSQSHMEFVTSGKARNETVFLAEDQFLEVAHAIVSSHEIFSPKVSFLQQGDPKRLAMIRHEIDLMHRNGFLDSESASNLLARIVLWMTDASFRSDTERLANGTTVAIAHRAQTFIEEKFSERIRLEDLCTFVGVGLRTLQRCFASYFQICPTDYIKTRRLNAARRDLVAADPSRYSVTEIAVKNGYCHLGRFSVDYRAFFGESPSQTLVPRKTSSQRIFPRQSVFR